MNFRFLAVNEFTATFLGSGLMPLLLASTGFKSLALVVGQVVYALIKLTVLCWKNRFEVFQVPRAELASDLMEGSLSIMIAETANMATVHIQRPMVGQALGVSAAGIWSRVYQIILIELTVIVQPLDNVILPIFSRLKAEKERFSAGFLAAIQAVGLMTLPIAVLTVVWTPLIIPILFGPTWMELIAPLQIGSFIVFFRGMERVLLSVSRAAGTMRIRARIQILQLVLIIGCLLPALKFGLIVSSWAYIGSLFLGFLISLNWMHVATGVGGYEVARALIPGIIASIFPLAIDALLSKLLGYTWGGGISVFLVTIIVAISIMVIMFNAKRFLSPLLANIVTSKINNIRRFRLRAD